MNWQLIFWVAVAVLALFLVGRRLLASGNRVITLDERCNVAFADIDAHLKHRHNLIPPLVETVRGFAKHEAELVLGVTRSHFEALRNELIDCENRITASRRFYNLVVGEFNASARQWPASMFARRNGLERRHVFDLGAERAAIDQPVAIAF
jgi:LemA protein